MATNPAPTDSDSVLIQSTDSTLPATGTAVSAADLASDLGLSGGLPTTSGSPPNEEYGTFYPQGGQAIYKTVDITAPATLTFNYSYATDDYSPYDSVGYVINGQYTQLVATPYYQYASSIPSDYQTTPLTVTLPTGDYTIGFVAYNTGPANSTEGTGTYSTSLYLGDVSIDEVPEPSTWIMLVLGVAGLVLRPHLAMLRAAARR